MEWLRSVPLSLRLQTSAPLKLVDAFSGRVTEPKSQRDVFKLTASSVNVEELEEHSVLKNEGLPKAKVASDLGSFSERNHRSAVAVNEEKLH
jgi:hypothetical protein